METHRRKSNRSRLYRSQGRLQAHRRRMRYVARFDSHYEPALLAVAAPLPSRAHRVFPFIDPLSNLLSRSAVSDLCGVKEGFFRLRGCIMDVHGYGGARVRSPRPPTVTGPAGGRRSDRGHGRREHCSEARRLGTQLTPGLCGRLRQRKGMRRGPPAHGLGRRRGSRGRVGRVQALEHVPRPRACAGGGRALAEGLGRRLL